MEEMETIYQVRMGLDIHPNELDAISKALHRFISP